VGNVSKTGAAIGRMTRYLPRRVLRWCALRRNVLGIVPVIVYQMAKVGSSAIVAALHEARLPVFHVHRMDAEHLHRLREVRRVLGWQVPPIPVHDHLGLRLKEALVASRSRLAIVTMVRDPIARNFSSYFEHLDDIWGIADAHHHVPMDSLIAGFYSRFPHDEPLTWFDDEMLPVTGIDVYRYPFPRSGHLIVKMDNLDLLILKNELAGELKAQALSELMSAPVRPVMAMNRTSEKAKGAVYRRFTRDIPLAPEYIDRMLGSRYARHFYTERELGELLFKYRRKSHRMSST
jgi:hypothetical protein